MESAVATNLTTVALTTTPVPTTPISPDFDASDRPLKSDGASYYVLVPLTVLAILFLAAGLVSFGVCVCVCVINSALLILWCLVFLLKSIDGLVKN